MKNKLVMSDLNQYSSTYLNTGFKQDQFEIVSVEIDENSLHATVNITDYTMPSDQVFHLSSLTSSRIIQQLAIIYTYASLSSPKNSEIYYLSEQWAYKKVITDPNNIVFHLHNIMKRNTEKGIIYFGEANVNNSFICKKASWFKPHANIHTNENK